MTDITMSDDIAPLPQLAADIPAELAADPEPPLQPTIAGGIVIGRLRGKVALVSGGDSGMGHAAAIAFARDGADVAILYHDDHEAAQATMHAIVEAGGETMAVTGDIGASKFCDDAVAEVISRFGRIDILVNAAVESHPRPDFARITDAAIERIFRTNILGQFFLTRAALPHLRRGATIVNTSSLIAMTGDATRIDDAATRGAVISFTRSLALALAPEGIRANAIAPAPNCPPEAAAAYVFLASDESRPMTGQVLHPDGGMIVAA